MIFIKFTKFGKLFSNNYRQLARTFHKSHYEVLELSRDCSSKQIKEAFIKLSKKYHPDRTSNINHHKEFLRVTEAYNVLSKSHCRRTYDLGLYPFYAAQNQDTTVPYDHDSAAKDRAYRRAHEDPAFWVNRDRKQDGHYESKPYYGIRNVKRISNMKIAAICIVLAIIAGALQISAIRYAYATRMKLQMVRSQKAEAELAEVKYAAERNGVQGQLQILQQKLKESQDRVL